MEASTGFAGVTLEDFLAELADERHVPGAGSAAAVAGAIAAALLALAARVSRESWPEAGAYAAQAEALRARALRLADVAAAHYEQALRAPAAVAAVEPERRDEELGRVYATAAAAPLELAELTADLALLGLEVAERADAQVQVDAGVALALAAAVARSAAELVAVNLTARPGDERLTRARELADVAGRAARRAFPP